MKLRFKFKLNNRTNTGFIRVFTRSKIVDTNVETQMAGNKSRMKKKIRR